MSDPAALARIARALASHQATPAVDAETLVASAEEAQRRQDRSERLLASLDHAGRVLARTLQPLPAAA